jgi:hypothetical protein
MLKSKSKTMYHDDYKTCEETYVTLCIYPGEVDPDVVTKHLAITPTRSQKSGDTPDIQTSTQKAPKPNAWFLSSKSEVSSKDLRRHIDFILDKVAPRANSLRELKELGSEIRVSCYWASKYGHGGPTISPHQMRKLVLLDIELELDLYLPGQEEK